MATKEIQERINRLEMMIPLMEDPVQVSFWLSRVTMYTALLKEPCSIE